MDIVFLIIAFILALTLHEFAHAWTSNFLGDSTARLRGRLSLNPLVHIDPVMTVMLPTVLILAGSPIIFGAAKPVPFNPWALRYRQWGAALVAIAGPLTNLVIAIFLAVWLNLFMLSTTTSNLLIIIIRINVVLAIFNLIPFPPLDGSRLLFAIAPLPLKKVMAELERLGLIAILIFFFIALPFISKYMTDIVNNILILIGVPSY